MPKTSNAMCSHGLLYKPLDFLSWLMPDGRSLDAYNEEVRVNDLLDSLRPTDRESLEGRKRQGCLLIHPET